MASTWTRGLLFVPADDADAGSRGLRVRLAEHPPVPLLGTGIPDAWRQRTQDWQALTGVVQAGQTMRSPASRRC